MNVATAIANASDPFVLRTVVGGFTVSTVRLAVPHLHHAADSHETAILGDDACEHDGLWDWYRSEDAAREGHAAVVARLRSRL